MSLTKRLRFLTTIKTAMPMAGNRRHRRGPSPMVASRWYLVRVFTASGGHFVRKLCLLGLAQRQMSLYLAQSHASCCDPF